MILQALVRHYENLAAQGKVSREGWCQAKVSYGINLSREGKITGIISLKQEKERGKKTVIVPDFRTVPEMVTRITPNIFWGLMHREAERGFRNVFRQPENAIWSFCVG